MPEPSPDACPLCRATAAEAIARVPYATIWEGLRREWKAQLSADVIARHQPARHATLVRCRNCELDRFVPMAPGDASFYEELMANTPYHGDRWEFGLAVDAISPGAVVVDLGCGEGAFLRRIRSRASRAVGVDHNEHAIKRSSAAGLEAYAEDFGGFAAREAGAFDVATSFHTLEHLPSVAALVEAARALLRPGGLFFVSVPNRDRFGRRDDEPMDCPPHHVSRWGAKQLALVGDRFGFELLAMTFEEPDFGTTWQRVRERSRPVLEQMGAHGDDAMLVRTWMRLATGPQRHARAARIGRYTARGIYGHAMLATFRIRP